jgi:hypothetical protein
MPRHFSFLSVREEFGADDCYLSEKAVIRAVPLKRMRFSAPR